MSHKFKVGQSVHLTRDALRTASNTTFKILALRPTEDGDPKYLIKSDSERTQRIVAQSAIKTGNA
jgi:hypothetical protein